MNISVSITLTHSVQIFLWFWFLFVLLATFYSLLAWMGRLLLGRQRRRFVCKYLKLLEQVNRGEMRIANKFVEGFLRPDGVFVIRLLSEKAGMRSIVMLSLNRFLAFEIMMHRNNFTILYVYFFHDTWIKMIFGLEIIDKSSQTSYHLIDFIIIFIFIFE